MKKKKEKIEIKIKTQKSKKIQKPIRPTQSPQPQRKLSLHPIPDFSSLLNLKSLFLNFNNYFGNFPDSNSSLHHLKIVVLAGN